MELIEFQEDYIVGFCIDGKVDNEMFDWVLVEIEDWFMWYEKICFYVELVFLGGIGLEVLFKDMKFGFGNWCCFECEVVVLDWFWVYKIVLVIDWLMFLVEVKVFFLEEKSVVLVWVWE